MIQDQIKKILAQYHLRPDKSFGQNFLLNDEVLKTMVEAADIGPTDTVLEVGPGIGNLTARLAVAAQKVVAVEKDLRLRELLSSLVAKSPNIDLHFSDILKFDFTRHMKPGYKVVANIPYYVTGKLVQLLLRAPLRPRSITVLIQKEVAENMVARAGKTNLLALSVQLVGSPQIVRVVPARDFFPIPKVDSAVAHIDLFSEPLLSGVDEKMFFRVAKACFVGKRKQLHNTLSANLGLPKAAVSELLGGMGLSPTVRPQELSVGQFVKLSLLIRPYLLA